MIYDYNKFKQENETITNLLKDLEFTTDPKKKKELLTALKAQVDTLYRDDDPGFIGFLRQSGSKIIDQVKDGYSSIKQRLSDLINNSGDDNKVGEKIKNTYEAFKDYVTKGEDYFKQPSMEKEDKTGNEMKEEKNKETLK